MLKYHSLRDKVFRLKNLYAAFKRLEQYKQEGYTSVLNPKPKTRNPKSKMPT